MLLCVGTYVCVSVDFVGVYVCLCDLWLLDVCISVCAIVDIVGVHVCV